MFIKRLKNVTEGIIVASAVIALILATVATGCSKRRNSKKEFILTPPAAGAVGPGIARPHQFPDLLPNPPEPDPPSAMSFLELIPGDPCTADGRIMMLINHHDSRLIIVKVRKSWQRDDQTFSIYSTYVVRPGRDSQRELGCTRLNLRSGETRAFIWEIMEVQFKGD